MLELGSRRGAAEKAALPLMIVAFLGIAGFLYWLSVTAVGTTSGGIPVVEEDPFPDAIPIAASALESNPLQFEGALLRIPDVSVVSRVGDEAFWTQLPNDENFFVRMGPELTGDSVPVTVASGDVASYVVGVLHIMNDSTLDAWEAQGAFENTATGRLEAEFADVFLELVHLEPGAPEAEEGAEDEPSPPGDGSQ